jgi:hypothetical protein
MFWENCREILKDLTIGGWEICRWLEIKAVVEKILAEKTNGGEKICIKSHSNVIKCE